MDTNLLGLPSALDCTPEFCFCGEKTVESHDFWFCSIKCARLDSLRSLSDPNSHYRNVVRVACSQGSSPTLQPRRVVSTVHLRPGPTEQRGFLNGPLPLVVPQQANVVIQHGPSQGQNISGFPTLSQVAGKVLTRKASKDEPPVAGNNTRQRFRKDEGTTTHSEADSFKQISLDIIPLPEPVPARTLRRAPTSTDNLRSISQKNSVTALLRFRRSRRNENEPEMVFGHVVDPSGIVPPVRKELLPAYCQMNTPPAVPPKTPKALRRSASFAGYKAPKNSSHNALGQPDALMHMIEEMREELADGFDPRSLFNQEEDY